MQADNTLRHPLLHSKVRRSLIVRCIFDIQSTTRINLQSANAALPVVVCKKALTDRMATGILVIVERKRALQ